MPVLDMFSRAAPKTRVGQASARWPTWHR